MAGINWASCATLLSFPNSFSLDAGLLAPLFLTIVLTLALDSSRLSQGLSHPWLVTLGDSSYALYILHVPALWLLGDLLALSGKEIGSDIAFLIYLPFIIALCIFVFKYMERPARDWLRTNPRMLRKILLDVVLILAMIRFRFALRPGSATAAFVRTQTFAFCVGIVLLFLALLVFRFYTTHSWLSLALATLTGTTALIGFIYFAWTSGWVEGFPRSIPLLIPLMVFAAIYFSRCLLEFLKPKVRAESELS